MIKKIFVFSILFVLSFVILSYPINNRSIFSHISSHTGAYTDLLFEKAKQESSKLVNLTKELGKKLFTNANPSASRGLSSTPKNNENAHAEVYSKEEVDQLKKLLRED